MSAAAIGRIELEKVADRRGSVRRACDRAAWFQGEEAWGMGLILDMSESGLFLAALRPPALGDHLQIVFEEATNGFARRSGRVARIDEEGFGLEFDGGGKEFAL